MSDPSRRLRVAHVTTEKGFSGGEVQLFLLLCGLRERGHESVVLCPGGSLTENEARRRGFGCRSVPRLATWPGSGRRLRRALAELRPDLVHLHSGRADRVGGAAAHALGLPAVTTRRMDRRVRPGRRSRRLYGQWVQRAVAISPAVADRLRAGGVPEPMLRTIYSAVDPESVRPRHAPAAVRAAEGARPGAPLLLTVARLVRRKGLDLLLDALAGLSREGPPAELWIAGEGPERGALEKRSRDRGLADRVRFLGQRRDVPDLLAASDVFVLPSRREGLGVAALEAMAAGRPVVASRVGGLGEVVGHEGTGLLVPPEDPAALRDALARLLNEPELRARLGAAGPARIAERHLPERMTEAYERLYHELLAEEESR